MRLFPSKISPFPGKKARYKRTRDRKTIKWARQPVDIEKKGEGKKRSMKYCIKTIARALLGHPDTEKQMNARGSRPSAFIVSRVSEYPDEARSTSLWYSFLSEWPTIIIH